MVIHIVLKFLWFGTDFMCILRKQNSMRLFSNISLSSETHTSTFPAISFEHICTVVVNKFHCRKHGNETIARERAGEQRLNRPE